MQTKSSSQSLKTTPYSFMSDEELLGASYDNGLARDTLMHRFFNSDGGLNIIHNLASTDSVKLVEVIWKGPVNILSFEEIYFILNLPHGLPYFYDLGVQYLKQSASKGEPKAFYAIGTLYENGKYIKQNYAEAAKYYKVAAKMGLPIAQRAYGGMYEDGMVVTQNNKRATKWYKRAAKQGDKDSQWLVGACYNSGIGFPKDINKAIMWYKKGAQLGDKECIEDLKRLGVYEGGCECPELPKLYS